MSNENRSTLTPKQENFCLKYIETGNASEAYRQAYNAEGMKTDTIHRKAAELLENGKITAKINELKAEHQARHKITVDDLLTELNEARQAAKENGNATAMIAATMSKAKLLELDKPNRVELEIGTQPLKSLAELFEECSKEN